ncbi:MAG TPA: hypothetical protein VEA41_10890 [Salinarimonas sp.]|nr:hypothetical protein [Salinarimonas sp.]
MMKTMRTGALVLATAAGLAACTTSTGQPSAVPAAAGTGILAGGLLGAAITGDARGAAVGALIGGVAGAAIGAAIDQANMEAAIRNAEVVKVDNDGTRIVSRPVRTYKRGGNEIRVVRATARKPSGETTTTTKEYRLVRDTSGQVASAEVL